MSVVLALSARITDIARVIDGEFREMPGMRLTQPQIRRLCHLSDPECEQALDYLCHSGLLTQDETGRFFRRRADY